MSARGLLTSVALVSVVAAISTSAPSTSSLKGGTYRVGWEAVFDWGTDSSDPTGETDPRNLGIFSNLLLRTLIGYNHVSGAAGRVLVPDLATKVPTPTNGGLTYTFTLKRGIRFGPPINRAIRSGDIRYAIERLARPSNGGEYASDFEVIKGLEAYSTGHAGRIAGIATPTPRTIVFTLTRPTTEFLQRLTLPAAAPIPREIARCFEGKPGRYGADLISSGPYMYEGANDVDIGSCASIKPMRGNGYPLVTLVRNPRYDPRTDSPAARENNPDRFVFLVVPGRPAASQVIKKLDAGELDDAILSSSPKVIGRYDAEARAKGRVRVSRQNWILYLSFNLTQPPFDDVHVRRAFAWAIDRAALRDAWGGALAGSIPEHLIPNELLGDRLAGFAPFKTPGEHGSLAKARAELAQSKYKTRHGVCVARRCKHVWLSAACRADHICADIEYAASQRVAPIVRKTAAKLGIELVSHSANHADIRVPSTYRYMPMSVVAYWSAQYPDASSFIDPPFAGWGISPSYNPNTSLVGLTPEQGTRLGTGGRINGVPNVDRAIKRCSALTGESRLDCYAALDRTLSTQVVAWIPFLRRNRITILGPQVVRWEIDASNGTTAYAHVAVKH